MSATQLQMRRGTTAQTAAFTGAVGEVTIDTDKDTVIIHDGATAGGKQAKGVFLLRTVKTTGTTFTTTAYTRTMVVTPWAGGGGGGGVAGGVSITAGAGGGAAGAKCTKVYTVSPATGYTYAVGAAGAGGAAGNNDGAAGGDSTFTDGVTLITAKGGLGGKGCAGAGTASPLFSKGGAGQISTNGDINGAGMNGLNGFAAALNTDSNLSGSGGSSEWGAGGPGLIPTTNASTAGSAGIGYASGGGGATGYAEVAAAGAAGGAGTQGVIIFDEYA